MSTDMRKALAAGGEMGALVRSIDWAKTPLGPMETWPPSLRTMAMAVLQSRFPMLLWWGRELINIYNDAYRPLLGEKHPHAMGVSAEAVWPENWHVLGPQAQSVLDGGPATWNEHLPLFINRRGFVEESYWTFSYSPAPDDYGEVGGILCAVQETTEQVQGERQLQMLRDLGAPAAQAKGAEDACRAAAAILAKNDADFPFALIYLLEDDGATAKLVATAGMDADDGRLKAQIVDLHAASAAWPLRDADTGELVIVSNLAKRFGVMPGGRWGAPPEQAVIVALTRGGRARPDGYLVAGASPMRGLDDRYERLFRLTSDQIVTAFSAARAFEEEQERAEAPAAFVTRGPLAATGRRVAALDWVFGGTGTQATLLRAVDWTTTSIGAVEDWSPELQAVVRLAMSADMPIGMMLGKDLTFFVNDAGAAMLGGKAAESGRPYFQIYPEIKEQLGPVLDAVFISGETIFSKDALFLFDSNGRVQEQYHTSANIPITTSRGIEGVFCPGVDSTDTVLAARRMRTLANVAAVTRTRDVNAAFIRLLEALDGNPNDVPFAIAYEIDPVRRQATLKSALHVESGSAIAPHVVDLPSPRAAWPFGHVFESDAPLLVSDLPRRFGTAKLGPWRDPTTEALVYPIGGSPPRGMFVVGLNRMRLLDPPYRDFLDLLAAQVNAGILEAEAFTASRKRLEALAEIDRAKTVFFSNVSHELRTPLTLLLGPLEEALADPEIGHRQELDVAHRNALRLQKLVNSLLDFARIEAGRIEGAYEPTDLGSLTADLASVFRSAVERAGLRLRVDCPPLPEPAYVDREMWEKIVFNLLSNAFKFTFDGEIAVSLRLEDGGQVVLTVRDTGVGIPEEELPRLFERFHRVRDTRARSFEGSGIGLSLVQELVRLHGGSIRVASSVEDGRAGEEHGTTFTVSIRSGSAHLPAERIHAARTLVSTAMGPAPFVEEALRWLPGKPPATESAGTRQNDGAPDVGVFEENREARVLVADDNADMRDYLARLLARHWTVESVADGQSALSRARQCPPDLVLADVMMPGLDGFGLLRELRADSALSKIPIMLLSARAGEESRVEGMAAGADDYLVKPFSARELVTRVGAHLALARQRRQVEATLRKSEERQGFLLELSDALRPLDAAAEIQGEATRLLREHFAAGWCYYVEWDEAAARGVVLRDAAREGLPSLAGTHDVSDVPAFLEMLRTGNALNVSDYAGFDALSPELRARYTALGFRSMLLATLVKQGRLVASLLLADTQVRDWSGDAEALLMEVAERTWAAVERARAEAALRASEARLTAAFASVPVGIAEFGTDGKVVLSNAEFDRFIPNGVVPSRGTESRHRWQAWDTDDRLIPPHDYPSARALRGERVIPGLEMLYTDYDGRAIWTNVATAPIFDSTGQVTGCISVISDITERKTAVTELRKANRAKDEFLAMLGHELRNPLAPIVSTLELMRLEGGRKFEKEREMMLRQALHLAALLDDLLDVARLARGKIELHRSTVALDELVARAVEAAGPLLEQRRHELDVDVEPGLLLTVDEKRIVQVISNLLNNAAHYTPPGGHIAISGTREERTVVLRVRDDGVGIAPKLLPHVFERFHQGPSLAEGSEHGLGVGLAIARSLVELHGGSVTAASEGIGKGSELTVRLAARAQRDSSPPPAAEAPSTAARATGHRILLVDDNRNIADVLAVLLVKSGHIVEKAYDALRALSVASTFLPTVAILDIGLPDMSGYELARQLRKQTDLANIKLIALTGYGGSADRQRSKRAGFLEHLPKPVEFEDILATIERISAPPPAKTSRARNGGRVKPSKPRVSQVAEPPPKKA